MQTHLRTDVFQCLHLEVRRTHPGFDRAEGMLDGAAANAHAVRHTIHTIFHILQYRLMLPATDAPVDARCALRFDATSRTG